MKDRGYAWVIMAACAIGLAVSTSPIFYNTLPVFSKSIANDTGWSRAQIISGVSVATVFVILTAPIIGKMVDRFGPRLVIAVGVVPFAICLASLGLTSGSYVLYLVTCCVMGIFGNCLHTFVYLSFIPKWFDRRLGLGLGLASTGIGIGQTINPLFANYLSESVGWRSGFMVLGAMSLVVTVLVASFALKLPANAAPAEDRVRVVSLVGMTSREAVATPAFWLLCTSFLLITVVVTGCTLNMVPLLTDRGLTAGDAARVAASAGLAVISGRLLTGFLLDWVSARLIGFLTFVGGAFGVFLLWSGGSLTTDYIGVILLGLTLGVEGDLMAYLVRRTFGERAYAEIYGYFWAAFNAGVLIGPIVMGAAFDSFKTYTPMLAIFIGLGAISALLILLVGKAGRLPSPGFGESASKA